MTAEEKVTKETIQEWVKQLGDENYKVREKAIKSITKLSFSYRKVLVEELKTNTNIEIQDRLKDILKQSEDKLIELLGELYLKSNQFYKDKKYDLAMHEINLMLDIDPEYEMAFELKAKVMQSKEEYKESIVVLKKLMESNKKSSKEKEELSFNLIKVYLAAGEFSEAVTFLEKLLTTTKWPGIVEKALSLAYELNNQPLKAEEILTADLKDAPNNEGTIISLAWFYVRIGKQDKAKPLLENYFVVNKNFGTIGALNYLLLEQNQNGAEKLKVITDPILIEFKDKKNLIVNDLDTNNILNFCFQSYFESTVKIKSSFDFKGLYHSFSDNERKKWPIPLLGLYGGILTIEQIETLIQNPDKMEMRMNKCEAYFYYGLLKLTENNIKDAKKYFLLSKEQNIFDYIEHTAAIFMLHKYK